MIRAEFLRWFVPFGTFLAVMSLVSVAAALTIGALLGGATFGLDWWQAVQTSALLMCISIFVGLPIGLGAAVWRTWFALGRHRLLLDAVESAMGATPTIVIALVLIAIISPASSPLWVTGVALGLLTAAKVVRPCRRVLNQVDTRCIRDAGRLGANYEEFVLWVGLPASIPRLFPVVLFAAVTSLGDTTIALVVYEAATGTGSVPVEILRRGGPEAWTAAAALLFICGLGGAWQRHLEASE